MGTAQLKFDRGDTMTGSVVFGCAAGLVFVSWFYAARLLRQIYMMFREAERLPTVGAGRDFDLARSRNAKFTGRLHAYASNDNTPTVPLAATGTAATSSAQ
jgi:hypothetical protein